MSDNKVKDHIENVRDTITEQHHRAVADDEKRMREELGNEMTAGEKAGSMFRQGVETTKAEIDAGKRELRKEK